jgi:hypothetical protein
MSPAPSARKTDETYQSSPRRVIEILSPSDRFRCSIQRRRYAEWGAGHPGIRSGGVPRVALGYRCRVSYAFMGRMVC